MRTSRRRFLTVGAGAVGALALGLPRPLLAQRRRPTTPLPPMDDPELRALATAGVDAAQHAGATYADVRLTHSRRFLLADDGIPPIPSEMMTAGVRALVSGYWGFASGPVWSADELARLGREAVHQAKVSALGEGRHVDLAQVPAIKNESWIMPVERDPFEMSPFEIQDFIGGLVMYASRIPGVTLELQLQFDRQDKAFASSLGSYFTQRTFLTSAPTRLITLRWEEKKKKGTIELDCLTPAGLGFEYLSADRIPYAREHPLTEEIRRKVEELKEDLLMPVKPVDVGRYSAVFDARSMGRLASETLGQATQLDRALGYEANASGTSYIDDPLNMVGSYQAGAPLLTLTANRSEHGGAASVAWDDEGTRPDEFALAKDGILVDFQTTRESAGWLKAYYAKADRPERSHGCAAAPNALDIQTQHTPNLVLAAGRQAADFDSLVGDLSDGIAIKGAGIDMDFQAVSGLGMGTTYEVKRGKRVAIIAEAGFLFRAPDLWKSLTAVGGTASMRRYGMESAKGEPEQRVVHSVTAPAAAVKELTVINPYRKA